ncbi:hypothetical protein FUAX_43720 (plasmid) [Fulvitalea axinellae]|uniref:FAS1 domain-containing protein n=1 Tax=Fulvitalea axinellae TaxID=1182444 RepID=A0AAU9DHA8_9BACT|nr:hypothetical protein FUAX_43720 [Fulvitalea axinellae]
MRNSFIRNTILFAALALAFWACDERDDYIDDNGDGLVRKMTVGEFLASDAETAGIADLLKRHGYMDSVSGKRPVTFFVPPKGALEGLSISEDSMKSVLSYHIGNTLLYDFQIEDGKDLYVKSLYKGKNIWAEKSGGAIRIDLSTNTQGDPILCSNGVVYKIDHVLEPPKSIFQAVSELPGDFEEFREYLLKDTLVFDKENSFPVGTNKYGETVYDSAWVTDFLYRTEVGDIKDEDRKFSCVAYDEDAFLATLDKLVERYYGDASNAPDGMLKDKEWNKRFREALLEATLVEAPEADLAVGDTLRTTNGRKIVVTQNWLDNNPKKRSNGFLYEMDHVDVLMSDKMGKIIVADGSIRSNFRVYDNGAEVDFELVVSGNGVNYGVLTSDKPFSCDYGIGGLMAGKYALRIQGFTDDPSVSKLTLDGKILTSSFKPTSEFGNWFKGRSFDQFGGRILKFEVTDANTAGKYKLGIGNLFMVPIRE